ncbi:MAG: hypothetical protein ACKO2G_07180 [Verrucomicrobiales bacterium]
MRISLLPRTSWVLSLTIVLLSAVLPANERTWTNVDGRTLRGVMIAKTSTTVTISIAGKEHQIPLDKLVEEDQKWVQQNSVFSRARFKVRTLKTRGDSGDRGGYGGYGADMKGLAIAVTNTEKQPFTVEVGWIGQDLNKNNFGLYRLTRLTFEVDGEQEASCSFPKSYHDFDHDYKGHFVVLRDSTGKILQQQASQEPLLRFVGKEPEVKEKDRVEPPRRIAE